MSLSQRLLHFLFLSSLCRLVDSQFLQWSSMVEPPSSICDFFKQIRRKNCRITLVKAVPEIWRIDDVDNLCILSLGVFWLLVEAYNDIPHFHVESSRGSHFFYFDLFEVFSSLQRIAVIFPKKPLTKGSCFHDIFWKRNQTDKELFAFLTDYLNLYKKI